VVTTPKWPSSSWSDPLTGFVSLAVVNLGSPRLFFMGIGFMGNGFYAHWFFEDRLFYAPITR
jgi:hypothetical protein